MRIRLSETKDISRSSIVELYKANEWSSANKPDNLWNALLGSHSLISAWDNETLVGVGNAISDGFLVVYYPHLLVHPNYHGKGVGRKIMEKMAEKYKGFHMQMLTADLDAVSFYKKMGFSIAGKTKPMWIYEGNEHS